MRRTLWLWCLCGLVSSLSWARAAVVTPIEARAHVAEAEQVLVDLQYDLTDHYYHQGEFESAVAVYDRIIALRPVGIDPYTTAAWLLWSMGKEEAVRKKTAEAQAYYRRTEAYYERMIAANPNDAQGYFEYGVYFVREKNDQEAVKRLERAVQLGLPAPQNHMYGIVLRRLGRTQEALTFWQRVIAEDPKDEIAQREINQLTGKESTPAAEK